MKIPQSRDAISDYVGPVGQYRLEYNDAPWWQVLALSPAVWASVSLYWRHSLKLPHPSFLHPSGFLFSPKIQPFFLSSATLCLLTDEWACRVVLFRKSNFRIGNMLVMFSWSEWTQSGCRIWHLPTIGTEKQLRWFPIIIIVYAKRELRPFDPRIDLPLRCSLFAARIELSDAPE